MSKASIIISVDNHFPVLNNFFNILFSHINKEEYEIIVIDDCSIDNKTRQYLNNLKNERLIDVLLTPKKKLGFGKANNLCVEESTTDCLIFMNTDIIINDDILDRLVELYLQKEFAAIQPLLLYPQTQRIQSAGHIFATYVNRHALENNDVSILSNKQPIKRQALTLAFCVIDKAAFMEAGKFNEFYYNGYEGLELTLKISQRHTCVLIPYLKAYHIRSVAVQNTVFCEEQKIPFFWCRCSHLITNDYPQFVRQFITSEALAKTYLAIQLTSLDLLTEVKNAGLQIKDYIVEIQDGRGIELFSLLPFAYLKTPTPLLFLCDNYTQLTNNSLWIQLRKNNNDLIIDSNGNVKKLKDIVTLPDSGI